MASSQNSSSANPAALISSLFKTDFDSSFISYPASSTSSSTPSSILSIGKGRKRRKSVHEEFRIALDEGRLQLANMDNAEPFVKWVIDGNKKVAIYCSVCEKFLGPNKGGSYFTHVRTCKNSYLYPGYLPSAPIEDQHKDDFSYSVVEAVGKDINLFNQINTEAFKECIQKALDLGEFLISF